MSSKYSIAILPFVNMSSDIENEYFSDGITEEIINALAKIDSLKVTSRTSSFHYKGKSIPVRDIGKALNVTTILEGSVRVSGNMLRITAQLIDTEEDFHFWSESWDRELVNIFAIQDEISLIIAERLREYIGHFEIQDKLVQKQTDNLEVYELYLKGKYYYQKWNPTDIHRGIDYFEKAISLDPNHAESYIGLSECFTFLAALGAMPIDESWEKATTLSEKAFELNSELPEVYFLLASIHFWKNWNYKEAYQLALKSLELKPSFARGHQFISLIYALSEKIEKSTEHIEIARRLDPLSNEFLFSSAFTRYMAHDFSQSLKLLNQCILENPKNVLAHTIKCCCLLKLGRADEVLNYFDHLPAEGIMVPDKAGLKALAYIMKGDLLSALLYEKELHNQVKNGNGLRANGYLLLIHAARGENDKAFALISPSTAESTALMNIIFTDPLIEPLKKDPRYQDTYDSLFKDDFSFETTKKKILLDEDTVQVYSKRLINYIDEEKPYLNPNLSLGDLADQIGIHSNQLSWLINKKFEKNFKEFINDYRVAAFKDLSIDPKNEHITLIGLAFESGFNSKTAFNTFFKKSTGMTPNQFLKKNASLIAIIALNHQIKNLLFNISSVL